MIEKVKTIYFKFVFSSISNQVENARRQLKNSKKIQV